MGVDRIRQLRGVVLLVRRIREEHGRDWAADAAAPWMIGRGLPCSKRYWKPGGINELGVCRWCGQGGLTSRRTFWHRECITQYIACQGLQREPGGGSVVSPESCCNVCGLQSLPRQIHEIDHKLAISVARYLGEREFVRAHLLSNLQWLCRACHAHKPAEDRREAATLRKRLAARTQPQGGLFDDEL